MAEMRKLNEGEIVVGLGLFMVAEGGKLAYLDEYSREHTDNAKSLHFDGVEGPYAVERRDDGLYTDGGTNPRHQEAYNLRRGMNAAINDMIEAGAVSIHLNPVSGEPHLTMADNASEIVEAMIAGLRA